MHLRIEPRFSTESTVVVQRLRSNACQLPARILDVSGVGFRLSVQEALAVGEPLRIITGEFKLLVMVRYSVTGENGHSVGVERIDAWQQDDKAVPADKRDPITAVEQPPCKVNHGLTRNTLLNDLFTKAPVSRGRKRPFLGGLATSR